MSVRSAAACWLAAGVAYVTLEAVAAAAYPGYRYASGFISDLGRPDSPQHHLMNAAFVVQGSLFFGAAALLSRGVWRTGVATFVGLAAANGVGNVIVASVPSGSAATQWLHVGGAILAIVGGNAAIVAGRTFVSDRRSYRAASVGLAAVGLSSFVLLAINATTSVVMILPAAVWERASVYAIIAWQVLSAVELLARERARNAN